MKLVDLLSRRGIPYQRSPSEPAEIRICCPFCLENGESADTHFRLGLNLVKGVGHCFNCDWKSRKAVSALLRWLKVSGSVEEETIEENPDSGTIELPEGFARLKRIRDDLDHLVFQYLRKDRRITKQQILDKGIGVSYQGRYAYRVVIPVRDAAKELRGFVARSFVGATPKYLNSPGEKYLFNVNPMAERVILAEGIFKALRLEQAFPEWQCCALLGHDLTPTQEAQLRDSRVRQFLLWRQRKKQRKLCLCSVWDL